jgi:hypothetical protein
MSVGWVKEFVAISESFTAVFRVCALSLKLYTALIYITSQSFGTI